ncbi:unnamed protein product [Coregonus sp. 'balchen']|nr:unnamed protein product [Coregonus sp. 'balchen']
MNRFGAEPSDVVMTSEALFETEDVEQERELRTHLSREEIRQKVELYNSSSKDHLKMTLNPSGVYTGFIKVQLELRRPITVREGRGGGGGEEAFYIPRGATNTLHISSNNTVRQVGLTHTHTHTQLRTTCGKYSDPFTFSTFCYVSLILKWIKY